MELNADTEVGEEEGVGKKEEGEEKVKMDHACYPTVCVFSCK